MFKTVLLIDNYMDRGLADAELCGGGPDRRLVLNDVLGQRGGPLLDIALQIRNTPRLSLLQPMRGPGGICRRGQGTFRGDGCPRYGDGLSAKGGQTLDKNGPLPRNPAKVRKRQRKPIDKFKKVSIFARGKTRGTGTGTAPERSRRQCLEGGTAREFPDLSTAQKQTRRIRI